MSISFDHKINLGETRSRISSDLLTCFSTLLVNTVSTTLGLSFWIAGLIAAARTDMRVCAHDLLNIAEEAQGRRTSDWEAMIKLEDLKMLQACKCIGTLLCVAQYYDTDLKPSRCPYSPGLAGNHHKTVFHRFMYVINPENPNQTHIVQVRSEELTRKSHGRRKNLL